MILIPVKDLSTAKQRLAAVLDQSARTQLAQTMLQDVVTEIASWKDRPPCTLVTSDPFAVDLAQQHDFETITDPLNQGESGAIEMATEVCVARGVKYTLVIPADIPLVKATDLEQIPVHAPETGSVLVPAADGRGTNAAFRRPANLFPLHFGNDSFRPHHAAAQATGKPCVVLHLASIGIDVDNPEDIEQILEHSGETRTQMLLRRWQKENVLQASSAKKRRNND